MTAQHEAPLAVLQEQIPEALRPLTISLLTSEREELRQLEQAVRKIADETRRLDRHALAQDIESEAARIDGLHQRLAVLDQDLRALATKQTSEAPFFGAHLQPAELARRVVTNEQAYQWFPDHLAGDHSTLPQVQDADIGALRAVRLRLGADLCYCDCTIPDTSGLPLPEDLANLHRELLRFGELQQLVDAPGQVAALREYSVQAMAALEALRDLAIEVHQHLQLAEQASWARVARPLLADTNSAVGKHIKRWVKEALELEQARQALLGDAVEVPAEGEIDPALYRAVSQAADGKRPFPWLSGDKALFGQIRRHGALPTSAADWQAAQSHLENSRRAVKLAATWAQLRQEFGGPPVDGNRLDAVRRLHRHAQALYALSRVDERLAGALATQVAGVFADATAFAEATHGLAQMQRLLTAVETHLEHSRLRSALNSATAVRAQFDGCTGPVVEDARRLLSDALGQSTTTVEEVRLGWQSVIEELQRIASLQGALAMVAAVTRQIAESGAIRWAEALRTEAVAGPQDPLLPLDWRSAWEWSRARGYLDAIGGREQLKSLSQQRLRTEADLGGAYERLVELRTWWALKENMTPAISAALAAYLTAVTRIGAGTGVRAIRYRRDARAAMNKAYEATPCWIMAHWRVSEALPPRLGLFDLVIIDEASQSDIRALPTLLRARQVLVVGDDKQVSPSDVGVKENDIAELQKRFLGTFPYPQHFLPGSSIYDLGSTMFAGAVIRLREHFRCVEPIIAFSNRHFYDGEIRPLRIPKPSERLDPPLIDVTVRGGYRKGRSKLNPPEADAIVREIDRLTGDPPIIGGRSIGVVSLLGAERAKAIQDRLLETIGEERFLRHRIRCGDAMHFQGKEADIVMVSMVDAGETIRATSGRIYEQRYNVACSRARDRLYVFHSFTRAQLKEVDLRAKLLDHLERPLGDTQAVAADLRARCESDFEREVFDALLEKGYRVTPQVRAGGFRIDLVAEGADDRRLAIECDGDRYQGVDRWLADMDRQRVLERMGWRFWRCWASNWFVEREACVADLIHTLQAQGIAPWSTDSNPVPPSLVEHRIVEPEGDAAPLADERDDQAHCSEPGEADEPDAADAGVAVAAVAPTPPEPSRRVVEVPRTAVAAAGDELPEVRCIGLNDIVDYCHARSPEQRLSVTVVSGQSQPTYGIVNQHTPLGNALLGATAGEVVEVRLPQGIDQIRVLGIRRLADTRGTTRQDQA